VYFEEAPILLSSHFFSQTIPTWRLKCLAPSIIYRITEESFKATVSENKEEFEQLMQKRDRHQLSPDAFQLFPCNYCQSRHSEFDCPKLHFRPLRSCVVSKGSPPLKVKKQPKYPSQLRIPRLRSSALKYYSGIKETLSKDDFDQIEGETHGSTIRIKTDDISEDSLVILSTPETIATAMIQILEKQLRIL
jgi:hypothetical protein